MFKCLSRVLCALVDECCEEMGMEGLGIVGQELQGSRDSGVWNRGTWRWGWERGGGEEGGCAVRDKGAGAIDNGRLGS